MSDVKSLIKQATPLPWVADAPPVTLDRSEDEWGIFAATRDGNTCIALLGSDDRDRTDAALIVHAVNHLPDYEAAVDALERLTEVAMTEEEDWSPRAQDEWAAALNEAGAILRRLRGEAVPS